VGGLTSGLRRKRVGAAPGEDFGDDLFDLQVEPLELVQDRILPVVEVFQKRSGLSVSIHARSTCLAGTWRK